MTQRFLYISSVVMILTVRREALETLFNRFEFALTSEVLEQQLQYRINNCDINDFFALILNTGKNTN